MSSPSSSYSMPRNIPGGSQSLHRRTSSNASNASNRSARSEAEAMAMYLTKMALDKVPMSRKMREDQARAMARAAALHHQRKNSGDSALSASPRSPSSFGLSPGPAPTIPLPPVPEDKGKGRASDDSFEYDALLNLYERDEQDRAFDAEMDRALDASLGIEDVYQDDVGPSELAYRSEPRIPQDGPRFDRRPSPPSPLRETVNTRDLWPDLPPLPPMVPPPLTPPSRPSTPSRVPEPLPPDTAAALALRRRPSRGPRHPGLTSLATDAPLVPAIPFPNRAPNPDRVDPAFADVGRGINAIGVRWQGSDTQLFGLRSDGDTDCFRFTVDRALTQVIEVPASWQGFVCKLTGKETEPFTRGEIVFDGFQGMTFFRTSYAYGNNGPLVMRPAQGGQAYSGCRLDAHQVVPNQLCMTDSGGKRVVCGTVWGVLSKREAVRDFYRRFFESSFHGSFDPDDNSTWQMTSDKRLLLEFW